MDGSLAASSVNWERVCAAAGAGRLTEHWRFMGSQALPGLRAAPRAAQPFTRD